MACRWPSIQNFGSLKGDSFKYGLVKDSRAAGCGFVKVTDDEVRLFCVGQKEVCREEHLKKRGRHDDDQSEIFLRKNDLPEIYWSPRESELDMTKYALISLLRIKSSLIDP